MRRACTSDAAGNSNRVIRLDDTASLAKCLKLWEQCCHVENFKNTQINRLYDFGQWLGFTTDEQKREATRILNRAYSTWEVEDQAYEFRVASPETFFLLQIRDILIHSHDSIKFTGRGRMNRGHELMDDNGSLKEDHPLVRELDIKLLKIIPVCTISISERRRCEASTVGPNRGLEPSR